MHHQARRTSEATSPSRRDGIASCRTEVYVELHMKGRELSNINQQQKWETDGTKAMISAQVLWKHLKKMCIFAGII
jgi:hypothetical protein